VVRAGGFFDRLPLADYVFGPAMAEGGRLAPVFGGLIGVGQARGMGLMFLLAGVLLLVVTAAAYAYPRLRLIEDELPDVLPDAEPASQPLEEGEAAAPAD
jgi:hypothetical protein